MWRGQTTEQELASARAQLVAAQDQTRAAIRDAENTRRALIRDRHRFANGVCPCCNRSFTALARHMATQHPDYDITKVEVPEGNATRYKCSCGAHFATPRGLHIHQGHMRGEGWDEPGRRWGAHLTEVKA